MRHKLFVARSLWPGLCSRKTIALAAGMLLCGGIGFALVAPSEGSAVPGQNTSQNPAISPIDRMFVKKAMQGSMAEVQLAQLTLHKTENEQVKQFAHRMIDDHTRLNEQMKPVLQQLGVDAPTEVSKKNKQVMAKLQKLAGAAYDQAYIKNMVNDHKQDLTDFQMEASSGQDQTTKDAASQGSKLIAQHLQMAQQMAKDQNVTMVGQ